jgi:hypothetical protein
MAAELTPQEEIENLVTAQAQELAIRGEHERAAALIIEHRRMKLADTHPSKSPTPIGVLEGQQVSDYAAFEQASNTTKEVTEFVHALSLGGQNLHTVAANMAIMVDFIVKEHQNLIPALSKFLILRKDQGMMLNKTDAQIVTSDPGQSNNPV